MKSVNILLVEDNEGDIFLTREALKNVRMKIELKVLKDGQEAIAFMGQEGIYKDRVRPDLLLLDLNLPKRNGMEVLQFIKQHDAIKNIPVIILSTSVDHSDIVKSYDNHANCYISKPPEADSFMKVLDVVENFWTAVVKLPSVN